MKLFKKLTYSIKSLWDKRVETPAELKTASVAEKTEKKATPKKKKAAPKKTKSKAKK